MSVGAVRGCAVISEQGEEQGTEHTILCCICQNETWFLPVTEAVCPMSCLCLVDSVLLDSCNSDFFSTFHQLLRHLS